MFFIMGVSQAEKKLDFDQMVICRCCGKYGHMEVFVAYSYFMLFFIPVFKWNRRYFLRMSCCGSSSELDPELGRSIEKGEVVSLNEDVLGSSCRQKCGKRCPKCGFSTNENYQFCPKCGSPI
ncbi:zinc ribbon domain-containing protein [Parasporobacterium paucivorans]|uniref:Zinc-ribbon domain-containing protein n=1 Tax=Parasporobacterium paucivorans DSM 15970 TaxID=1122934 RepID=A0A1M6G1E5_9FIRM|nr:zinc ribbon domain-containing protein [Parasporobacterium paucivorans]SHJ03788.1 zinc-ribbon domain-containing protein [Parasporobacterium paucivorans DSM 15970]